MHIHGWIRAQAGRCKALWNLTKGFPSVTYIKTLGYHAQLMADGYTIDVPAGTEREQGRTRHSTSNQRPEW
jgi:hypothetical protein